MLTGSTANQFIPRSKTILNFFNYGVAVFNISLTDVVLVYSNLKAAIEGDNIEEFPDNA